MAVTEDHKQVLIVMAAGTFPYLPVIIFRTGTYTGLEIQLTPDGTLLTSS